MKPQELAQLCNISVRFAYYILSGDRRPSVEMAQKLAERTDIPAEAWIFPDKFKNPYINKEIESD